MVLVKREDLRECLTTLSWIETLYSPKELSSDSYFIQGYGRLIPARTAHDAGISLSCSSPLRKLTVNPQLHLQSSVPTFCAVGQLQTRDGRVKAAQSTKKLRPSHKHSAKSFVLRGGALKKSAGLKKSYNGT